MIKKSKMHGNYENYNKMFKMVKPEIPLALARGWFTCKSKFDE